MRAYHLLLSGGLLLLAPACFLRKKPKPQPAPVAAAPPAPAAPARPADVMRPVAPDARLYYDDAQVFPDSSRITIRDEESLRNLWNQASSGQASAPPLPAIDWTRHMVLLVTAGQLHPGDQIRVDSVGTRDGRPVAIVRTTVECQPFPATTYPFEMVRVRRSEGPVEFVERRTEVGDCAE